jgi:Fic family protein
MNPEDFSQRKTSGQMVKSPQGAWAFVPNPLPPKLEPTWEMAQAVAQATGSLKQLAGVAHTLPNENLLLRPFLQREAVLSSRIEGTVADLQQFFVFEAEPEAELAPNFEEIRNYVKALYYGLERSQSFPISLPLLKEMHAILMQGVRGQNKAPGEFRKTQNWIGGATPFEARYVPPPPPEMNQALREFEKYLHAPSPIPFLVRLAFIHYQFEAIHPFLDGNGRIGRLLLSLLLCDKELLPRPLLYLSGYFERHRREYYDGLLAVSRESAWQEWTLYFLRGVDEQARDAALRATRLMDLWARYRQHLHDANATLSTHRLLDELFVYPSITAKGAEALLDISMRTARLAIDKLCEQGILKESTGKARYRVFMAEEISSILDAPEEEN